MMRPVEERTVTIDHLGAQGDGVADGPLGRLHVPFTAPGDTVRVVAGQKDKGALVEVLVPGPDRVKPPCAHFGRCGGCALQHLAAPFIAGWKRQRVVDALRRVGLEDIQVADTVTVASGTRRRATLAASRIGKRVLLGFAERASHRLVDLRECHVLRPELVGLIGPLRERLPSLLESGETADFALTWTETGIDCVLIRQRSLTLLDRETLADFAESFDLARVSWRPSMTKAAEPVAARRVPMVAFDDLRVPLPGGAFLQPSVEGQRLLIALVESTLNSAVSDVVADLFCGVGTFAIPAGKDAAVSAFDNDPASIAALRSAGRALRLTAEQRDLFREPLTAKELGAFDAVILDPPRAGAQAQVVTLADSLVGTVVYVSCNPTSFARDAATLDASGCRLLSVTPIDQFQWSPHTELVGVFRR